MSQNITLDTNNKLVIYTDNGKVDGDNIQTTEIKGTFEINAEDVAILGALLNDMSFIRKDVYLKGYWIFAYDIITKEDGIKSLIKRIEDKCKQIDASYCEKKDEYKKLDDSYHKCCHEYYSLKAKVEEHNKRPFSRKIKLD